MSVIFLSTYRFFPFIELKMMVTTLNWRHGKIAELNITISLYTIVCFFPNRGFRIVYLLQVTIQFPKILKSLRSRACQSSLLISQGDVINTQRYVCVRVCGVVHTETV